MLSRKWQYALVAFVLFVLLTPGVIVTIPPRGCNIFEGGMSLSAAVVHGIIFTALAWLSMNLLRRALPS